ncbi:class I SAM-dependent methyltransferase [Spirulina subsalsa FACHB-351]|uniref:Class I SAM-dependent methyltransferase n=1 Tax=Spirulina subsalsa FACHB-351 TaxID=234711 RepID=A0ABT3L2N3_9CYAN|nr:class I SAM-dependent methyltransferase [Spirulina subsalsa]MCW6035717.1 class I SAM-dependent methyltransferase [Spirulina subsalsa FACHB-351]
MLLKPEARTKYDSGNDEFFYSVPRLVTHVDDHFIDQLTQLYRERLKPNSRILDLMSSWVSHLPDEVEFAHVEGHGMNEEELRKNPRLNHYFVQNLNSTHQLPLADGDFDAVLICVSVQYLQYPEIVLSEVCRILKPGGLLIISFSNRMFYQKAIAAWRDNSEMGRVALVKAYLKAISGFNEPEVIIQRSELPSFLQMLGMGGQDPFYAVIAERKVE